MSDKKVRPLRRTKNGRFGTVWRTRDGKYEFMQHFDDKAWSVYLTGDDDVATYERFDTLWEAVNWVDKQEY